MGFVKVKHLDSTNYNRILFYIDGGPEDLPPIIDQTSIAPGSEARSLGKGDLWKLNSKYEWVLVLEGSLMTDVPEEPFGVKYVRESTPQGPVWTEAKFTAETAVPDFAPYTDYLKHQLVMYNGGLYRARNDFTSGAVFNPADWEAIEQQIITKVADFVPFHLYAKDEVITDGITIWRAKTDFTSGATFNALNWEKIIDDNAPIPYGIVADSTNSTIYADADIAANLYVYTANKARLTSNVVLPWTTTGTKSIISIPASEDVYYLVVLNTPLTVPTPIATIPADLVNQIYTIPTHGESLKGYTMAEWNALAEKPEFSVITNSIYDM